MLMLIEVKTTEMAIILDFRDIPLPALKSLKVCPKYLLFKSLLYHFSLLLAKQYKAIIIKVVPGIMGKIYPAMPSPVEIIPRTNHMVLKPLISDT